MTLGYDPALDPRMEPDANEVYDCFVCGKSVERRRTYYFGESERPHAKGLKANVRRRRKATLLLPQLPAHEMCLKTHMLEHLWILYRNAIASIHGMTLGRKLAMRLPGDRT